MKEVYTLFNKHRQLQYTKEHDTEIAYGLLMQNVKWLINKWEFIGNITCVLFLHVDALSILFIEWIAVK